MERHEKFAAAALQGLIAARTDFDFEVEGEIELAWRYADAMEREAAREQGIEYSNRDRRLIGEVLDAYGRAHDAGNSFSGRCELSHTFTEVCRFTFTPKQEDQEGDE